MALPLFILFSCRRKIILICLFCHIPTILVLWLKGLLWYREHSSYRLRPIYMQKVAYIYVGEVSSKVMLIKLIWPFDEMDVKFDSYRIPLYITFCIVSRCTIKIIWHSLWLSRIYYRLNPQSHPPSTAVLDTGLGDDDEVSHISKCCISMESILY